MLEQTVSDSIQKLIDAISKIAPEIWKIMVNHALSSSLVSLGVCLLFFSLISGAIFWVWKNPNKISDQKKKEEYNNELGRYEIKITYDPFGPIAATICLGALWVILLAAMGTYLIEVLNPQYYAIYNFVKMIK